MTETTHLIGHISAGYRLSVATDGAIRAIGPADAPYELEIYAISGYAGEGLRGATSLVLRGGAVPALRVEVTEAHGSPVARLDIIPVPERLLQAFGLLAEAEGGP